MGKRQLWKMVFSFILPPVLVILLFTMAISVFILPSTENALMQKKKDTVRAIVVSTTSILEKHAEMEQQGLVTREKAQQLALAEMRAVRYGDGHQEYLWITDLQPVMLMHPHYPELEGTLLDTYTDSRGNRLFVKAVAITKESGEGYIDYLWSKGRNTEEAVPKLSYVKLLQPWGWIVGSGIYLDDVHREIREFSFQLLLISGMIGGIVLLLLLFVIHRGWKSETGKYLAEEELRRSRERYQALAHASDEMILLVIDGVVAGANKKACDTLTMKESELIGQRIDGLLADEAGLAMLATVEAGSDSPPRETMLRGKSGELTVLLSAQHAVVHNGPAILYSGCALHHSQPEDTRAVTVETLHQCGFGVVLLDVPENGTILFADPAATSLLAADSGQTVVGKPLLAFLQDEEGKRLLLQLSSEKLAARVRLSCKGQPARRLLAWAAVLAEESGAKGQIAMLLLDDTGAHLAEQATDELVTACIAPDRTLHQPDSFDRQPLSSHTRMIDFLKSTAVVRLAMKSGLHAEKATEITLRSIDRLFQAEAAKAIDLLGAPPCPYALLALGSIGRREAMLNPDQDTALIYEASDGDGDARRDYFNRLGTLITDFVAETGLPPCDAGNSASNPSWCLSETGWTSLFTDWINASSPEDLLQVNIFFDLRTMVGDDGFASRLRRHIFFRSSGPADFSLLSGAEHPGLPFASRSHGAAAQRRPGGKQHQSQRHHAAFCQFCPYLFPAAQHRGDQYHKAPGGSGERRASSLRHSPGHP